MAHVAHGSGKESNNNSATPAPCIRACVRKVPVEGDGGDDVARAQPAVDEAGGEAPHAVDEFRAGEPSAGSSGDGGVAAAGEDPSEALRNVALAVAWRWHRRRPAGAVDVDRAQAKLRLLETLQVQSR